AAELSRTHASAAVPPLIHLLQSTNNSTDTRANAAQALGNPKLPDDGISAALLKGLEDSNLPVCGNCAISLWRRDPRNAPRALPFVIEWLPDYNMRFTNNQADLYKLSTWYKFDLKAMTPELKKLLNDPNPQVRRIAR